VPLLVAEQTFPVGHSSPTLTYEQDDVLIYMLEGELTIVDELGDERMQPGDCVTLRRGEARAYRNDSGTIAKGLIISHPGIQAVEFYRNLDRASRAARPDGKALTAGEIDQIAGQYGVQIQR
jgi:uncharacterized cupin superfamily protein